MLSTNSSTTIAATNPANGTLPNPIAGNNPITGTTNSSNGSSGQAFKKSFENFLTAARDNGMCYARTDPSESNGMDCVTSLWGFLKNYLTPEDFKKLEPHKPQAYVWKEVEDMEKRIKGFSGAVEAAGLGEKSQRVNKDLVGSLIQQGDAAVKKALIGSIYTYSGKDGGHVSVVSDAWIEKGPNGTTIKYKLIGAHKPELAVEGRGLGTHVTTFDLMQDTNPGENVTLTQLKPEVVAAAEAKAAKDPRRGNNSNTNAGLTAFNRLKGLLGVA